MKELLDSCCVIDILDGGRRAGRMRALAKRSCHIVICRQVLKEVQRKRGLTYQMILARMRKVFGQRRVELDKTVPDRNRMRSSEERFGPSHAGDSAILELGRSRGYRVITRDRGMLLAAMAVGVVAVTPTQAVW